MHDLWTDCVVMLIIHSKGHTKHPQRDKFVEQAIAVRTFHLIAEIDAQRTNPVIVKSMDQRLTRNVFLFL